MDDRKATLKAAGFKNQNDAAEGLNVSRHTVHRWANGEDKECTIYISEPDGSVWRVSVPMEFGLKIESNGGLIKKLQAATKNT